MVTEKVPVTFLNGVSSKKDVLGVISIPDVLPRGQMKCRIFFHFNGQWGRFAEDFDMDGKSMAFGGPPNKAWWVLGKNGEVIQVAGSTVNAEQIPGAGLLVPDGYGYVNTIKNIDGELYVCGYHRQVYKRVGSQWLSIADGIVTRETATGFFDIDGTNSSQVYAVGWKGEIYFHDGREWHRDDSPTNAHLASVRCIAPDNVWICGNGGILLHGSFGRWQIIRDVGFTGNWYCIEEYESTIYLAGNGLLAYVDGNAIRPVDVGLNRPITTNRLHAKEGLLWSIGEKDILVFDGKSWREIPHPDNI